jgi:transcriptional regulator with XRE-family HTH domain
MNLGENIKKIRKEKNILQKEAAAAVGLNQSNYNKMENGHREPTVSVLQKLADLFGVPVDYIINPKNPLPKEVFIEDKTANQQLQLISQLDDEDKQIIFKIIDRMLTNKKFKLFFMENVGV